MPTDDEIYDQTVAQLHKDSTLKHLRACHKNCDNDVGYAVLKRALGRFIALKEKQDDDHIYNGVVVPRNEA